MSILKVSGSISQKITLPPKCSTTFAVDIQVKAGTIASSPFLKPNAAALGFKKGDEAIVPAFTWISTANVVEHLGGKVIFCDIDPETFNIDTSKLEALIGSRTKAIIPVHLFGLSADIEKIMHIAKKYSLWVIEDAACGFGSTFKDKHVGGPQHVYL